MKSFWEPLKDLIGRVTPVVVGALLLFVWVSSEIGNERVALQRGDPSCLSGAALKAENSCGAHHSLLLLHGILFVVVLFLIFFADALEVAYSLLRYKDVDQFSGVEKRVIEEMHEDESLIYEAREWLVTVLIVFLTVMLDFKEIYFGTTALVEPLHVNYVFQIEIRTIFSLLFTSLPVLWFAQGLSKRIAKDCPQKMLGAGALVWAVIKLIGRLTAFFGLDRPTEILTSFLKRSPNFSSEFNLKASDYNFYISSLLRYGYSLHQLETVVSINSTGGCEVLQKVLFYSVSGTADTFARQLTLDSRPTLPISGPSPVMYCGPIILESDASGRNRQLLEDLREIADSSGRILESSGKLFAKKDGHITLREERNPPSNQVFYRIDTHGATTSGNGAFAVIAEFTSFWDSNAFAISPRADFFEMQFDSPCYVYKLRLELPSGFPLQFSDVKASAMSGKTNVHWGEGERLRQSQTYDPNHPNALCCELRCPCPGTTYRFDWTLA